MQKYSSYKRDTGNENMTERKKVLCLLHLPPPIYGVTAINKDIISGELAKRFSLDIIPINTARKLSDIDNFSFEKLIRTARIFFSLLIKLFYAKYAFCYFSLTPTGKAFYKDFLFVLLLKIFKIKRLYHLHGKGICAYKNIFIRYMYKFCFKDSKVIILSDKLYYDIKDYVEKDCIYVLCNAIIPQLSDKEFNDIIEKRYKGDKINLLFLSNMVRSKGVFTILESLGKLRRKGYIFNMYFMGGWFDIKKDEFFDAVSRYGLGECVVYLGFGDKNRKNSILKKADIFLYPTHNDAFGIVNIEALEFGLPIISTDEGAIPDIVKDGVNGFLIKKREINELTRSIERLIRDRELCIKMGRAGRKIFLQKFTFDKFERDLVDIFRQNL